MSFRLTTAWHTSRMTYGPAVVAPIGGGSAGQRMTRHMATAERENNVDKERSKAVELAVGQIEKQFGKGSIMRLGGKDSIVAPIPVISTGSISLDWALGVGGFPRGRVIEIFGPESSGKTTLALQTIAQAQKLGGVAAFVDA